MVRTLRWIPISLVAAAGLLFSPAVAYQAPAEPKPAPAEATAKDQNRLLARELMRLSMLDLRALANPQPVDYREALALLGFAHELDPDNKEIVRRQIEAAHNAGDQDAVIDSTRAMLLLDPADTVAQLRFITDRIAREHQTAEARLAAYDKFISSKSIDPAIRSRLALDAALLLRERGDEKGFVSRLLESLKLDSSHKEAATLAATYFADRVSDDAGGRIELLVNLLKSDPIDPNIHMSLARELAIGGSYASAARFHTNAVAISSALGAVNPDFRNQQLVISWCIHGPMEVLKAIKDGYAAERDAMLREHKRKNEGKANPDNEPMEEPTLPFTVGTLAVLAAEATGDRTAVEGGVREFAESVNKYGTQLRDPKTRGKMTDQQATAAALDAVSQLILLRLWVNVDVDKNAALAEPMRGLRLNAPAIADVIETFAMFRSGKVQEAIDRAKDMESTPVVRILLGLAYESLGKKAEAIENYREAISHDPFQLTAPWSRSRLASLGAVEDKAAVKALERLVEDPRVPAWIDRMAYRPGEFIRVSAAAEESFAFPGQAVAVTISVTNQSDVPLGLGPDRPISSRIALMSKLSRGVPEDRIRPEIIDAEQRLRLMPRETLKVTVWPGVGQSGWALDAIGNRNVTVRWRVIHGFVMDNSGTVLPGALGTAVETDSVLFRPLPDSMCTGDELAKRIAAAPLSTLTRHMLLARASVLQPLLVPDPVRFKPIERIGAAPVSLPAEVMDGKPVAQAFAARYASLPRELRALIAVIVPHARLASDYAAVDAVVRADQDPLIRCIALCTRVIDPQDELLRSGSTSDDLRVRAVAAAVSAHLTTPAALYARMSPDSFPKPDAKKPAPPK